jgi:hypothetical protein
MSKLLSHGEGSDLFDHVDEVVQYGAAKDDEVAVVCGLLHDCFKATKQWQEYIRGVSSQSPHRHAHGGGYLAAAVFMLDKRPLEACAAFCIVAAHHSELASCRGDERSGGEMQHVYGRGVHDYLTWALQHKDWPDHLKFDAKLILTTALDLYDEDAGGLDDVLDMWSTATPYDLCAWYITQRQRLGLLVYGDHQSASKQAGDSDRALQVFDDAAVNATKMRIVPQYEAKTENELNALRTRLCHQCIRLAESPSWAYTVDAPTGLGKTEGMLRLAEELLGKGKKRIVYGVPLLSISEQIAADYLKGSSAQVYNYKQKEFLEADKDEVATHHLMSPMSPYDSIYNLTTFNRILLSACHSSRLYALEGLKLRDAVVIMDEWHKLPPYLIPLILPFLHAWARQHNCVFILGSATRVPVPWEKWGIPAPLTLDEELRRDWTSLECVSLRRNYRYLGRLTLEKVWSRAKEYECAHKDKAVLVICNVLAKGTFALSEEVGISRNPFKRAEGVMKDGRMYYVLDATIVPCLRYKIINAVKTHIANGEPVTLFATQIIEAGVDLDFHYILTDYQSLSSLVQRGGRTGRNGKFIGVVDVYTLMIESGQTMIASYQCLWDVQSTKLPARMLAMAEMRTMLTRLGQLLQADEAWLQKKVGSAMAEATLQQRLQQSQQAAFDALDSAALWHNLMGHTTALNALDLHWESMSILAALYETESSSAQILYFVETEEKAQEMAALLQGKKEEKHAGYQALSNHSVVLFNPDVAAALTLACSCSLHVTTKYSSWTIWVSNYATSIY